MIDLSQLKQVLVDPQARFAHAGPGVTRHELLSALGEHGLVVPLGGCSETGISGLTLGGGEGDLTAKYGVTLDTLLSAEVVTADGRVMHASADENPDLFWGIRGGGGNLGVVTSFPLSAQRSRSRGGRFGRPPYGTRQGGVSLLP